MLWPQFYTTEFPHLGATLKKPQDPKDPISVMWWTPSETDFVPLSTGLVDGLGQLDPAKSKVFDAHCRELVNRVRAYAGSDRQHVNKFLLAITQAMRHSCARLVSLPSTLKEFIFGVTEFQRYYIETAAALDYLQVFKPLMDDLVPAATVNNRQGVFVADPRVVQEFFEAGLPVYYVRKASKVFGTKPLPNVLKLVNLFEPPEEILFDANPPFPAVFKGSAMDPGNQKYSAIHQYTRTKMVYHDAFGTEHSTPDPVSGFVPRANMSSTRSMDELLRHRALPAHSKRSSSSPSPAPSSPYPPTAPGKC
jgi:hypothetical protein